MKSTEESIGTRKGAFDTGIRKAWTGKPQLATNASFGVTSCGNSAAQLSKLDSPVPKSDIAKPISAETCAKKMHQMSVHLTSDEHEAAMERAKAFPSFNAYMRHALAVERASRKPSSLRLSDEEIGRAVRVMIEEGRKP